MSLICLLWSSQDCSGTPTFVFSKLRHSVKTSIRVYAGRAPRRTGPLRRLQGSCHDPGAATRFHRWSLHDAAAPHWATDCGLRLQCFASYYRPALSYASKHAALRSRRRQGHGRQDPCGQVSGSSTQLHNIAYHDNNDD